MGDIRAGLEELKLDGALFADVKYYVSGEGDPKVCHFIVSRVFPFPLVKCHRARNVRRDIF